ncbi:MAG TPA: GtrA family protein [Vicinamibacterales bacterium]|jgi:putative flippase GtrA
MSDSPRALLVKFGAVGAMGFVVQVAVLAALTSLAGWTWLPATVVSVEFAILHNFLWHERWTWAHRGDSTLRGSSTAATWRRFVKFNTGTAVTSMAGNVALMAVFIGVCRFGTMASNVAAVATVSAANFLLADRWVFRAEHGKVLTLAAAAWLITASVVSAQPHRDTLASWDAFMSARERALPQSFVQPMADTARDVSVKGTSIRVPSGTINDWTGSVLVRGVPLDDLLARLQDPGTPPPQDDVVASRVLSRGADALLVYMRLVRNSIVTVTYDTEHRMTFARRSRDLATARSVATKIDEVGGDDHGFLWRMNSYWTYRQVDADILVSVESLTLSRDVPLLVRPIAGPIVSRIARDSLVRTLEALRRYMESSPPHG